MEYNNNNETFSFDSVIENEGDSFVILPEGDYMFVVKDFQRGNFPGSNKIPPCLKAMITVTYQRKNARTTVNFRNTLSKITISQ